MSARARLRAILAVAAVLVAVGAPARAHPFGQQPVLFVSATGDGVAVRWVANSTEFDEIARRLGLGPRSVEGLGEHPAFRAYFLDGVRVEASAKACGGRVLGATSVPDGGVVEAAYDCGGAPRAITLEVTILLDISEKYVNLVRAGAGDATVRAALTAEVTSVRIDFGTTGWPGAVPSGRADEGGRAQRIVAALQGVDGSVSLAVALGLAFVLGLAHGVTPGHGKTIAAAYLVGSGGTVSHALALAAVVTATHAVSTGLIAAVPIALGETQPPGSLSSWLEIGAGVLIVGFGVMLLRRPAVAHDHDRGGPGGPVPLRRLAAIGFVGGLVPNPEALLVVLVAFSLRRWTAGASLVGAFSLGLGVVVLAVSLAAVKGGSLVRRVAGGRLPRAATTIAAGVFVAMGALVLTRGVLGL